MTFRLIALACIGGLALAACRPATDPVGSPEEVALTDSALAGLEEAPAEEIAEADLTVAATATRQRVVVRPTGSPSAPAATVTPIPTIPGAQATSEPAPSGDRSGPQSALSANEVAAQNAGLADYSGVQCVLPAGADACVCRDDTSRSQFTFADPNTGRWTFTTAAGETVGYDLTRQGVDTWTGAASLAGEIRLTFEIVFGPRGFSHAVTIEQPGLPAAVCTNRWERR